MVVIPSHELAAMKTSLPSVQAGFLGAIHVYFAACNGMYCTIIILSVTIILCPAFTLVAGCMGQ